MLADGVAFCLKFKLTGKWNPNQRKLAVLMEQVTQLRNKFAYCQPFLVTKRDMKLAFKLAKEAIVSQIKRPGESSAVRMPAYETCLICYEDKDANMIFSVVGCTHRYCYTCMKQYVEGELLHGRLPKCPHEGCDSELSVDSTSKFLTPKLVEIMKQRIKEASIPIKEKIYCPIEKCSALMSKSEVLEYSQRLLAEAERSAGARLCKECNSSFCINCKVPWHSNMSCYEFKRRYPDLATEETKLKKLAATNLWRQCKNCNHMIELSSGCYHIICRY